MSNKAITTNDLKAVLDVVLPPQPSEYKKLLWTNPSPTSAFNAQDVNLDLSDYDAVDIECKHWSNDNTISTTRTEKSELGTISITSNANGHIAVRDWSVYADRVYFGTGKDLFGTSLTNPSNSACVPYKIYGIKYERVLPPAMDALEWKLKGTATGNNTVAMPTDYNEIMLVVTGYSTYYFTMIVAKSEVSSSNIYPRFASYYNTSNNAGGYCEVNNSTARLSNYTENNGTAVTSQATFKLYYR